MNGMKRNEEGLTIPNKIVLRRTYLFRGCRFFLDKNRFKIPIYAEKISYVYSGILEHATIYVTVNSEHAPLETP